jgi:hypothetical protein
MRIPEGQKNLKKTECFGFGVVSDQSSSLAATETAETEKGSFYINMM